MICHKVERYSSDDVMTFHFKSLFWTLPFRRHPVGVERCSICNYFCGKGKKIKLQNNKDIRFTILARCVAFFFSGQGVEAKKWLVETPLDRKNVRMKAN